ncbi:MAG: hypothetical protein LH473_01000 [Chitinophagales bacterium]|nr:hypothetical protein [Chitinophagales bacterium]
MEWCESSFEERWINRDYSIIKIYDFENGKETKLTSRTKYFSPAPSPEGNKIACIRYDEMSKCSIVILDSKNGSVLKEIFKP